MTNTSARYRLYYNPDGTPRFYSMEELEGEYVIVDQLTFERGRYDVIVTAGKIVSLSDASIMKYSRTDSETDTTQRCHPQDMSVVVKTGDYLLWDYRLNN